jgi:predicted nucleotidyltransferase
MPLLKLSDEDIRQIEAKRQDTLKKIEIVRKYLCSLGAKTVYTFGSVLTDEFRGYSDVDIGVEGLPYEHIYRVEAKIEEILGGIEFDLIYMEYAPEHLVTRIKRRGERYACHIS